MNIGVCGHRQFNVDDDKRFADWCESCQRVLLEIEPIIGVKDLPAWLERPQSEMYGRTPLEMMKRGHLYVLWAFVHTAEVPNPGA